MATSEKRGRQLPPRNHLENFIKDALTTATGIFSDCELREHQMPVADDGYDNTVGGI